MGRAILDLSTLKHEKTYHLDINLEDDAGVLKLSVTISGATAMAGVAEGVTDLRHLDAGEADHKRAKAVEKYALKNTLQNMRQIGLLIIKVMDIGFSREP